MYSSAVDQIELEGVSLSRKGTWMFSISLLWGNILEVCSDYLFFVKLVENFIMFFSKH